MITTMVGVGQTPIDSLANKTLDDTIELVDKPKQVNPYVINITFNSKKILKLTLL